MKSTLKQLQKALIDEIGMSRARHARHRPLQRPSARRVGQENSSHGRSSGLGCWFERRYRQYVDWVENGEPR